MFPTFIGRENEVRTLEERINGCMERSMNGRPLPEGGPEMKAMLAYIRYISEGVPVGKSALGRGIPALPLPDNASDPQHGAKVYQTQCATCHQPDGQGKRLDVAEATQERRRFHSRQHASWDGFRASGACPAGRIRRRSLYEQPAAAA